MASRIDAVRRRYSSIHPDHKRIAWGAATVALFVMAAKVVAAAKEMTVAWKYGVSGVVDAYQLALTMVTWLPGTLASVMLIVLIPALVRAGKGGGAENQRFLAEINAASLVAGGLLTLVGVILWPSAVEVFASRLTDETRAMARAMALDLAPIAAFTVLIGALSARTMAREQHANSLLEGVPAVTILVFLALSARNIGIAPLVWGTVIGLALQTLWLAHFVRKASGHLGGFHWPPAAAQWRPLLAAAGTMGIGQLAMGLTVPLDQVMAARLGDSAIATLGYANRIVTLLLSLGAMAIGRAILPILSAALASGEGGSAKILAFKWAKAMVAFGLIVALAGWALAPWGVALLFQHGAFTAQDTQRVTEVLRLFLIQVPFYFSGLTLVQLLAGQGRYRAISIVGCCALPIKWGTNLAFSHWFGIGGIALGTAAMYASTFCMLWLAARNPAV